VLKVFFYFDRFFNFLSFFYFFGSPITLQSLDFFFNFCISQYCTIVHHHFSTVENGFSLCTRLNWYDHSVSGHFSSGNFISPYHVILN